MRLKLVLSLLILAIIIISTLVIYDVTIGEILDNRANPTEANVSISEPPMTMSYAAVTFPELMNEADTILAGQVLDISSTRWNQDSGEYWEETIKDAEGETTVQALPYFELTLLPAQTVVDTVGIDSEFVITVIGYSPQDYPSTEAGIASLTPGADIIVFLEEREIAWWNGQTTYNPRLGAFDSGRKTVLAFVGAPNDSMMVETSEGLYDFPAENGAVGAMTFDALATLVQETR